MRVELDLPESVTEPRMRVKHQPVLAMALRRGSVEMGLRRSEMKRRTYDAGEMSLIPRHLEKWFRNEDLHGFVHRHFGRPASGSRRWHKR